MPQKIVVPPCAHNDKPKHALETSYEYFEFLCAECNTENNRLLRQEYLKDIKKLWQTGVCTSTPLPTAFPSPVRVVIMGPHPSNPRQLSGRPDGLWFRASLTNEEFQQISKNKGV